jgi:uncharacterized BrkB/YihY/UPF0761 family membrane protein
MFWLIPDVTILSSIGDCVIKSREKITYKYIGDSAKFALTLKRYRFLFIIYCLLKMFCVVLCCGERHKVHRYPGIYLTAVTWLTVQYMVTYYLKWILVLRVHGSWFGYCNRLLSSVLISVILVDKY